MGWPAGGEGTRYGRPPFSKISSSWFFLRLNCTGLLATDRYKYPPSLSLFISCFVLLSFVFVLVVLEKRNSSYENISIINKQRLLVHGTNK
jgi:hypothetical protein